MTRFAWTVGLLSLLAGSCAERSGESGAEPPSEYVEPRDLGKADNAAEFYLYVHAGPGGEVTLREKSDQPLPGAPDPLTDFVCAPRFLWDGVERVECVREAASLEVLFRVAEKTALTIFRPEGRSQDRRSFASCTTTDEQQPLPGYLRCSFVTPSLGGGELQSPFASSVPGVPIPNAHWVDAEQRVLRGMAPQQEADYQSLGDTGVEAVLIFKKPTRNGSDVATELTELGKRGFREDALLHVPFRWKDFPDFAGPCRETLQALRFVGAHTEAGRRVFFHCTVGEDRTGYLAAIYRLVREPQTDLQTLFHGEMCERGYGSGNPLKPVAVTSQIALGLTPLFRAMAFQIRTGQITAALEDSACETDPAGDPAFADDPELDASHFACGTSTRFRLD